MIYIIFSFVLITNYLQYHFPLTFVMMFSISENLKMLNIMNIHVFVIKFTELLCFIKVIYKTPNRINT